MTWSLVLSGGLVMWSSRLLPCELISGFTWDVELILYVKAFAVTLLQYLNQICMAGPSKKHLCSSSPKFCIANFTSYYWTGQCTVDMEKSRKLIFLTFLGNYSTLQKCSYFDIFPPHSVIFQPLWCISLGFYAKDHLVHFRSISKPCIYSVPSELVLRCSTFSYSCRSFWVMSPAALLMYRLTFLPHSCLQQRFSALSIEYQLDLALAECLGSLLCWKVNLLLQTCAAVTRFYFWVILCLPPSII